MARISHSYKSMLLAVLPLAVAISEAEHAVLAGIVDSLALIEEKAKAGRRARYAADNDRRKTKSRGYAATQRATGKRKAYAEILKEDGRSRVYQARYKFGEYAEAALILHAIESAPTQPIKGIEHV